MQTITVCFPIAPRVNLCSLVCSLSFKKDRGTYVEVQGMQGKPYFSVPIDFSNGLGVIHVIRVHSPTISHVNLQHLIVVF